MYVHVQIPLFSLLASISLDLAAARMGGQFLFPPQLPHMPRIKERDLPPSSSSPVRLSRPTFPLITSSPLAAAEEEEEGSPTQGRQTAFPPLARHGPCVCNFSPRGSPYVPPSLFSPLRCCRHRARGRTRRAAGRPRCQKNNEDEVLLLLLQEMCPPPPYLGGEGEGELKRQPRKKERGASPPPSTGERRRGRGDNANDSQHQLWPWRQSQPHLLTGEEGTESPPPSRCNLYCPTSVFLRTSPMGTISSWHAQGLL